MSTKTNKSDLSGMLGEVIKVRKVGGSVVVENRPRRKMGEPKGGQLGVQSRFLKASRWAERQLTQPEVNTLYAKRVTDKLKSAYLVAMSDYLNAPSVESINTARYRGAIGDPIVIAAADDFMVTQMRVEILNQAGALIEAGEAVEAALNPGQWSYAATAANPVLGGTKIRAIAYDRPGNTGTAEVVL